VAALAATTGGAVGAKEDSLRRAQGAVEDGMTAEIDWQHVTTPLFKPILDALKEGLDPEEILARMGEWFPMMNGAQRVRFSWRSAGGACRPARMIDRVCRSTFLR